MQKEKILARSRAEKKDEGMEYSMNRGRLYGMAAMTVIYIALFVFNWIYHQKNYSLFAMYWVYLGFESLGRYTIIKKPVLLFCFILSIIIGILFIAAHIISVVR